MGPIHPAEPPGSANGEATITEKHGNALALVTLHLDHPLLHRPTRATILLQNPGKILNVLRVIVEPCYHGDRLSLTASRLEPEVDDPPLPLRTWQVLFGTLCRLAGDPTTGKEVFEVFERPKAFLLWHGDLSEVGGSPT